MVFVPEICDLLHFGVAAMLTLKSSSKFSTALSVNSEPEA